MKLKRAAIAVIIGLFVYLSLYSWNLKSGQLDRLAGVTGLEVVKWVLWPGEWVHDQSVAFWDRYIYLVGLKQLNDQLSSQNDLMRLEIMKLRERAAEAERYQRLLGVDPVENWKTDGARVIAHRMGPSAALDSIILGKGSVSGVKADTPVVTPLGVVGRVVEPGLSASKAMLISDLNSRISVRGQTHRSTGLLVGSGDGETLSVKYMKLNAPVSEGEILVTSGLADIFPSGLPIAKVVSVERSDISLFLKVVAVPLVDMENTEEVLLLYRQLPANSIGNSTGNSTGSLTAAAGE
ncbi:rod shape-determining protein MreC [Maridesulfovibrio hydrothermalis]|uniref:Cell shape-determining protein MreC n=1 Tax=Maridesulfovibrio hydrothermalis AM13 = DSM 14728 TaxID=1121451 RepID=L0R9A4_9BACT|nr:rod shape-determining protein MreC [Maridesulfovibrio hydrothermalis]CCO23334.1 Rod shape-determining protein MreC [Maridesulfovibrio hydrothermalis AM13 = DSM 14728]